MKRTGEKVLAFISGILGIILSLISIVTIVLYKIVSNNPNAFEGEEFKVYKETLMQIEDMNTYTYLAALSLLVASVLSLIVGIKLNNENNKRMATYLFVATSLFLISQSWLLAVITIIAAIMSYSRNE